MKCDLQGTHIVIVESAYNSSNTSWSVLALITRKKKLTFFCINNAIAKKKKKERNIQSAFSNFSATAAIVRLGAFVCISFNCHRRDAFIILDCVCWYIAQGLSYHMISYKCQSTKIKLYHDLIKTLDLSNLEGWFKYNRFYK